MTLHFYNTLSRQVEAFRPLDPTNIRIYVCGPTVYDLAHIGNARPAVVFDVLARLLRASFPRVTHVSNITDIEDKIIARSQESGESIADLTRRTGADYRADMAILGVNPPDIEPWATAYIPQMQAMIAQLIERGHAYESQGHVLFNVPSMPDYGRLSRHSRDELIAGARVEVAPYKRDAADFVLWKPSSPEQPGWDSPWGRGRPGWHIECSAMAQEHLGPTFDIHAGGLDLIFPHHENEIAQSQCAHDGAPMARFWMHNGFLTVNGEKMSKSLGNFFTLREILAQAPGEALRLALLSSHYRQPLDYTAALLAQCKASLDRWYGALRQAGDIEVAAEEIILPEEMQAALGEDLNTPRAIALMHEWTGELNKAETPAQAASAKAKLLGSGAVLGLLGQDPDTWFHWQPVGGAALDNAAIEALIAARQAARAARDFGEADRLRAQLAAAGVELEDSGLETMWRRG
ncbi:MAG: cysteine--tRNA ligase [Alphaproteobacteria bacterium]|nr:MAG: cysteine--tRNA ligase [Alphaproteobacteria bacterium]